MTFSAVSIALPTNTQVSFTTLLKLKCVPRLVNWEQFKKQWFASNKFVGNIVFGIWCNLLAPANPIV